MGRTSIPRLRWRRRRRLLAEGAALVDVGGESTRPGADAVSLDEELRRVLPVLEGLAGAPVSIDTSKAEVARRALGLGAALVNDVTALRGDPALAGVIADAGAYVCLMHMQGEPRTMQVEPRYDDVVGEVVGFLEERLAVAVAAGIPEEHVCLDPGIGFGKTPGAEPRAAPRARPDLQHRAPGARRAVAEEHAGARARRSDRAGWAATRHPSAPQSPPSTGVPRSSAPTTSAAHVDALAVAAAIERGGASS